MKKRKNDVKKLARRYPRVIRWSDEDRCFVGSLPDLDGDCTHGKSVEEVSRNLDECAELAVEDYLASGEPLPEVRTRIVVTSPFREWESKNEIAKLRKAHGVSQKDFADMLGVALSTLIKWENGVRTPSGAAAKLLDLIKRHPELV